MKKPKSTVGWVTISKSGRMTTLVCQTFEEAVRHAGLGEGVVKVRLVPIGPIKTMKPDPKPRSQFDW